MLVEHKVTSAAWPRGTGSTVTSTDRLQIAYLKFKNDKPLQPKTTTFNFVFAHGTGMNKSIWRVHIEELFKRSGKCSWQIGSIVSVDAAGHGDSAGLNKGKLSWAYDWRDGGKDLIEVVKHEASTTGDFAPSAYNRNILVGHSMGGYQVTIAAALEPELFDSCIAVEPVIYFDPMIKEFFLKKVRKLEHILLEEFPSQKAVDSFFKEKSFYKTLDPKVLEVYMADEVYNENGKFRTKASNRAQMSVYLGAVFFLKYGMAALAQLQIPYLLVVGSDAQWNHPNTVNYFQEQVPEQLLEVTELEGDHLVHAQNVKDTLDMIMNHTEKRAQFLAENRSSFPEFQYKDKEQMVKEMFDFVRAGDESSAYWYDKPKPKI